MGSLASLMLSKGYAVSGSDIKESQMTSNLRQQGAEIFIGHDAGNLKRADCVIYSSAIGEENPEMREALRKEIPIKKRAELLAQFVNSQTGITVAGAHGKTTTTAMVAHLLMHAGFDPSIAVGGIVNGTAYHARLGAGKYFVAEVDESDGSFLFFKPFYSVVTNIDFEHLDYYHNWENILQAYRAFIGQTKAGGYVFAYAQDLRLKDLISAAKIPAVTYGQSPEDDLCAQNISLDGYSTSFDCVFAGKKLGQLQLKIPGVHNVLNALACIGVGLKLGIDFAVIQKSLSEYQGVKRRFQLKADINGILVVDDYGHHPTEIISTLQAARSFKRKRIVTVFQPHRYSRTQYLLQEFVQSLSLSDYLVLTDIYAASEKPLEGASTEELYKKIKERNVLPVVYLKKEDIVKHLLREIRDGDLVIILGAGDITWVGDDFVRELQLAKSIEPSA